MKRIEKFEAMKSDFRWAPKLQRLTPDELEMIGRFLELNENADYNEFAALVNRMFLSTSGWPQTKNMKVVQEALSCLHRTKLGCYGYHGTKRWVHPSERCDNDGKEWIVVDETDGGKNI